MRLFVITSALFFCFFGYSQKGPSTEIESLEQQLQAILGLEKEQPRTETTHKKIDLLCHLSKAYDGIDSTKTFDYVLEALQLSEKLNYSKGIAHANFMLGRALMYLDHDKAFEYLEKGKVIIDSLIDQNPSKDLQQIWASGTYNLALTHGYLGDHGEEISITNSVIPVVKILGDSLFLANIHTNLGVKYLNLSDFKDAHKNLLVGREIYRRLNDPKEVTFNQIQLAMALEALDSLPQMRKVLDAAKTNLNTYPNDFDEFNYRVQNSQYHLRKEAFDKALFNLRLALTLLGGDTTSVQYGMIEQRMARVYDAKKDYKNALTHITKYIENSRTRNNQIAVFQGYYKRAHYAAKTNDYKTAYTDMIYAVDIYDSIEANTLKSQLRELDIKYETAEKEKNLLILQNQKNEVDLAFEKQRSRTYLFATIVGSLAFLILIGYLFYRDKLRKVRKKEHIREAEVQLLKQEQQNKIFSAMIEGQEKERKRLAIDLHDGLGGRLSGISLNLSKLDKDEPKQYPKRQLQKVMKDLNDSLQELRSIARNLMPETLVKFGLEAALKDYCSSMTGSDTKVTLQFYGSEKAIAMNQQVTIYRVIQELINNAVKHANASEVLVQYIREGNTVNITVEDNGVGFTKETEQIKASGMGLSNLRTRVAYLKGELDVQSEANEGTTVNVHLNIDAA